MKTFNTDSPILRYLLLFLGFVMASFVGSVAALLLVAVIVDR